jgi:hypothetical protein
VSCNEIESDRDLRIDDRKEKRKYNPQCKQLYFVDLRKKVNVDGVRG